MIRHSRPVTIGWWPALAAAAIAVLSAAPASAQKEVLYSAEHNYHRFTVQKTLGSVEICQIQVMNLAPGREAAMGIMASQNGRLAMTVMGLPAPSVATAGPAIFRIAHGADGTEQTTPLVLAVRPEGDLFFAEGALRTEDADSLLASKWWEILDKDRTRLGLIVPPESHWSDALLEFQTCRKSLG